MNLNPIKAWLAPYMLWVKLAAVGLIFGGGVWLGFELDPDVDCGQLDAETAAELASLRVANAEYEDAENARTLALNKEQSGYQNRMANEIKAALARQDTLATELAKVRKELDAAKADPKCADLMELEICEAITIPLQPR